MRAFPAPDAELVELVARGKRRARVLLSGTSMEPLLRAGMVVDIEPLEGLPSVGDVVVFRSQRGLVAHRLVGGELLRAGARNTLVSHRLVDEVSGTFLTAGDAHPDRVENFLPQHVVGRVSAVWASAAPDAERIDDRRHRRRGRRYAQTRALRSLAARARAYAVVCGSILTVDPATFGPPAFRDVISAMRSFEHGDFARGVALLDGLPRERTLDIARRHHVAGLVSRWLDTAARAGVPLPPGLHEPFRRTRLNNALQAARVLACVRDVRDRLIAADIPQIVLKGGARLAAAERDADLHYAGDVDVLVPAELVDRALGVLRNAGYHDVQSGRWRAAHGMWLHHGEPLILPRIGVPVEIHRTLAPAALVSQALDYAALEPMTRTVTGPAGEVRILDNVGAALHLAYHARDFAVWRDIILLARLLHVLDPAARARFDMLVDAERRDAVRLRSAVLAAEAFSGDAAPAGRTVRRYLAWVELREDLPRRFGSPDIAEALIGHCRIPKLALHSSREVAIWLRCWLRNLSLLPLIARCLRQRPLPR